MLILCHQRHREPGITLCRKSCAFLLHIRAMKGWLYRILSHVSSLVSASNGGPPSMTSYAKTPVAHISIPGCFLLWTPDFVEVFNSSICKTYHMLTERRQAARKTIFGQPGCVCLERWLPSSGFSAAEQYVAQGSGKGFCMLRLLLHLQLSASIMTNQLL